MAQSTNNNNLAHIFLLGATGRSGGLLLAEALRRGHPVSALVRDTVKAATVLPQNESLQILAGDPCDSESITKALKHVQQSISPVSNSTSRTIIIMSTLGQTRKSGNPWSATTSPAGFMGASTNAVIEALSDSSIRNAQVKVTKLITMSTFGTGASFDNLNFLMRQIMLHSNMVQTVEDHNLVYQALQDANNKGKLDGIEVVQVRSTMLKGDEALPVKIIGDEGEDAGFWPSISMKSVVGFMLDVAVAERGLWDGRTPVITN